MDLIQQKLGIEAMEGFALLKGNNIKVDVEKMYQAFKKRLIAELAISGGAYNGVVYGKLKDRWKIE